MDSEVEIFQLSLENARRGPGFSCPEDRACDIPHLDQRDWPEELQPGTQAADPGADLDEGGVYEAMILGDGFSQGCGDGGCNGIAQCGDSVVLFNAFDVHPRRGETLNDGDFLD
jgi:hypothetical protein